ncbi:transcriptional regulator, XRE family with cupin sensor [Loktanella fryxellensis]|uniref:Transcriptional regulator, XRE family with cupin sensor n=1 Tax=Loktanella fryxellensis TaxID=245187 RepID=A0A1H7Z9J9_9RHOB|nr:cupin domain-containing protein [Loktanella fryxellensis]SEM54674.1 transcriptional regulator, XRE family with cupin sensor [Loktanella fryxellensis]
MNIGERLRNLRESHGLSQRELATRAGLTNGTISLIEKNKTSPSVASLKSLLDAIPMSMAEFFTPPPGPDQPTYFYTADRFVEIAPQDGDPRPHVSLRQLGRAAEHALQMLHETYPPGADTGPELLRHAGEEAGIVVRGRIEVTVDGQTALLGPGDGYIFDSRLPHRFRNPDDTLCEIVSACTPPTF